MNEFPPAMPMPGHALKDAGVTELECVTWFDFVTSFLRRLSIFVAFRRRPESRIYYSPFVKGMMGNLQYSGTTDAFDAL
ncbi:MAG: hypothetical protein L0Z73_13385 [Gammaproteobacteria bacterium]|nr:hypothetical protein [Gammaproteobacteria bacterium]